MNDDAQQNRRQASAQRTRSLTSEDVDSFVKKRMIYTARSITTAMHTQGDDLFHVKGSMAAMLHGGDVMPGDIDMVVRSYANANSVLTPMGYPEIGSHNWHLKRPPETLPPIDVLKGSAWNIESPAQVPTMMKQGVRVTSLPQMIQQIKKDHREEKRERNNRLIAKLSVMNESPF